MTEVVTPPPVYCITNRSGVLITVPVYEADHPENRSEVFVQPKGTPRLTPGWRVDAEFLAKNFRYIREVSVSE